MHACSLAGPVSAAHLVCTRIHAPLLCLPYTIIEAAGAQGCASQIQRMFPMFRQPQSLDTLS